jgi:hypothetical protein
MSIFRGALDVGCDTECAAGEGCEPLGLAGACKNASFLRRLCWEGVINP